MTRVSKKLFKPCIKQVLLETPNIEHGTKNYGSYILLCKTVLLKNKQFRGNLHKLPLIIFIYNEIYISKTDTNMEV